VPKQRYSWAATGDVNAFFGLMLDNVADLLLTVGLLSSVFEFPTQFAFQAMVPGTAIGVLVGDLLFFAIALRLARRTGRTDITAMPLGLDTPSTLGMVFFVLGPAYRHGLEQLQFSVEDSALYAWRIGICSLFFSGLFKMVCALGSNQIRRLIPRAGLLGSLAAIALVLISFLPMLEMFHYPVVGLVALSLILTALVGRVRMPWGMPGTLGTLLIASAIYYLMLGMGWIHAEPTIDPRLGVFPTVWLSVFPATWIGEMRDAVGYLPVVIPLALGTVVGGIDCTESAAAAGDEFDTREVIAVEALATLVAALFGGVIQTTPYIGHPAYKAMGGRAAYTLATALFVGLAGVLGLFGYFYWAIPKATVLPILVFVGLEITAQSFAATPRRHYCAVAIACVPALGALAWISASRLLGGGDIAELKEPQRSDLQTILMLNNGFIVTSLLWASALAAIIDRQLHRAAVWLCVAALCAFCGVIHSPLQQGPLLLPWMLPTHLQGLVWQYVSGYVSAGLLIACWGTWWKRSHDALVEPAHHGEGTHGT
jgi:AGZA family xanthine/uracil permease-like MFS transporter